MSSSKKSLMGGAAIGALVLVGLASTAQAAESHKYKHHAHHAKAAAPVVGGALLEEVKALKAQVEELQARLDTQVYGAQQADAKIAATQAQVAANATTVQEVQVQAQQAIKTIPAQVKTEVAANKPKTDKIYYKGVTVTLGGFAAAESVYRSRALGTDISTAFASIPFKGPAGPPGAVPSSAVQAGHTDEFRASARQSRLSLLVEGDADAKTHLSMYGEFDFLGGARTANYNESNSFTPRIRHFYGTIDRADLGLHLLAGQTWSLATLNSKGITPRNEQAPPQIDPQFIPGFVWARQAQLRVTKDLYNKSLWLSVSAENPQTTFGPTNIAATTRVNYNVAAGSTLDANNNISFNHVPDIIAKAAYEGKAMDRTYHVEAFGIFRDFYNRVGSVPAGSAATVLATNYHNDEVTGYGVGLGGIVQAYPKVLDLQASALYGKGVGRYGTSQLPDVTFRYDGKIEPVEELMWLVGGTAHYGPQVDVYAFGGGEFQTKKPYTVGSTAYGLGNGLASSAGCFNENATTTCSVNTKYVEQATVGMWWRFYQGAFGRAQVGAQYSYTERAGFYGTGSAQQPLAEENTFLTSFRYYPF